MTPRAHATTAGRVIALVLLAATGAMAGIGSAGPARTQPAPPRSITLFEDAPIHWVEGDEERADGDFVLRTGGQTVTRTLELPPRPADEHARIVLTVDVTPVEVDRTPRDPWNRLGSVTVAPTGAPPGEDIELMRFVTGFGSSGRFEADVTAFAPRLAGTVRVDLFLATYKPAPAWLVSARLDYEPGRAGQRRPALVKPVFRDGHVTSESALLRKRVTIPAGLERPRIVVVSTGHATDGAGANEFVTCSHVLRVDGRPIALWRPWAEDGPAQRAANPWAGQPIPGEPIVASDLDRSGWQPGRIVAPLVIPAPELTPGEHLVELSIEGIRPRTEDHPGHGFWVVDAVIVADAPLPPADG